MKYPSLIVTALNVMSLPVRGAWIEMRAVLKMPHKLAKSLPVRGAWIEMHKT